MTWNAVNRKRNKVSTMQFFFNSSLLIINHKCLSNRFMTPNFEIIQSEPSSWCTRSSVLWHISLFVCSSSKVNTIQPYSSSITSMWLLTGLFGRFPQMVYSYRLTVWRALSSTCCSSFVLSSQLFILCLNYNHLYSKHYMVDTVFG